MFVVIAEVERPIADLIEAVVKIAGHTSVIVPNGRQTLEVVRTRRPALLIVGLFLPELDCMDLLAALQPERASGLQTILLGVLPALGRAVGASAVLPIPFHIAGLEELLARLLPV